METLGQHVKERYAKAKEAGDGMRDFWATTFAVIDERAARDNTVLLVQYHYWYPEEALDWLPEESRLEGWKTMRVTFERAISAFLQVSEMPWNFFDEPGKSCIKIEDDVWDVEDMRDFLRV